MLSALLVTSLLAATTFAAPANPSAGESFKIKAYYANDKSITPKGFLAGCLNADGQVTQDATKCAVFTQGSDGIASTSVGKCGYSDSRATPNTEHDAWFAWRCAKDQKTEARDAIGWGALQSDKDAISIAADSGVDFIWWVKSQPSASASPQDVFMRGSGSPTAGASYLELAHEAA